MAPRSRGEAGFSLIELLVVLVVLGILAAIAVPAAVHARRRGHDAAALVFLRRAVAAEETYASDHGAYAPDAAALFATGLRRPSPLFDLVVLAGGSRYCLVARHRRGGHWYAASSEKGLYPTGWPASEGPGSDCP